MASEVAALGLGRAGQIEGFEFGIEQAEQRLEFFGLAAVRGRREHDQVLTGFGGYPADEVVALLLRGGSSGGARAGVGFIDDDEFGALLDEDVAADVGLDEIDADDLERVVIVNAGVALDLAVETGLGIGTDDDGLDVELGADFLLPLFAEVREADDGEAFYLPAFQKFPDDEERFDGLADADVIRDQESHGILPERHDQRDDLVSARPEGKFGKGAEGAGAVAEGQPGGIVEQAGGADVAEVGAGRRGEASVHGAVRVEYRGEGRCR